HRLDGEGVSPGRPRSGQGRRSGAPGLHRPRHRRQHDLRAGRRRRVADARLPHQAPGRLRGQDPPVRAGEGGVRPRQPLLAVLLAVGAFATFTGGPEAQAQKPSERPVAVPAPPPLPTEPPPGYEGVPGAAAPRGAVPARGLDAPGPTAASQHGAAAPAAASPAVGFGNSRMAALFFWFFAACTIGGGLFVITRRNPVTAVMGMVGTFVAIAGLYLMLYASFLAAIQVLVYAGAIMVLFVFVVMILNRPE